MSCTIEHSPLYRWSPVLQVRAQLLHYVLKIFFFWSNPILLNWRKVILWTVTLRSVFSVSSYQKRFAVLLPCARLYNLKHRNGYYVGSFFLLNVEPSIFEPKPWILFLRLSRKPISVELNNIYRPLILYLGSSSRIRISLNSDSNVTRFATTFLKKLATFS